MFLPCQFEEELHYAPKQSSEVCHIEIRPNLFDRRTLQTPAQNQDLRSISRERPSDRNGFTVYMPGNFANTLPNRGRVLYGGPPVNSQEALFRQTQLAKPNAEIDLGLDKDKERPPAESPASPLTILGAGRVDPFANYPIKMDLTEYWLIDHVNVAQHPTFKVFKDSWLPAGMSDPATFHQILSNVALSISIVRGQGVILDNPVSAAHNSLAVRTVNNRLSHPVDGISDSTITSVLSLTCYSAIKGDFTTWSIHLQGLNSIIALRGGFSSLDNNPKLRLLIFWVEVAGACRQDISPVFPLPTHLLPVAKSTSASQLPSTRLNSLALWKSMFPTRAMLPDLFDDVSIVITLSRSPSAKKDAGHFNLHWISPLIYRLLSMSSNRPVEDVLDAVQESARLGLILFLAEIRRKCGDLGVPTAVQSRKLRVVLSQPGWQRWALFEPLILWCLFFGALESGGEDRGWFCNSMVMAARNLGLKSWKELVSSVSSFLWISDMFEGRVKELRASFDFEAIFPVDNQWQ